jgi:hypothetical protein
VPDVRALLAELHLPPSEYGRQLVQTRFRQRLVDVWGIPASSTILEIGCGQGDMTLVLASTVGADGHVEAIDAAGESSGSPLTFAQATARIMRSRFGQAISFRFGADILDPGLALPRPRYDGAVLAHASWYFASPDLFRSTLERVADLADRLYLSEWDLQPARPSQVPHFAAALVQGRLAALTPSAAWNIQTLMSRQAIERIVKDAGWTIEASVAVDSSPLQDGQWEIQNCLQLFSSDTRVSSGNLLEGLDIDAVTTLVGQSPIESLPSFALLCVRKTSSAS